MMTKSGLGDIFEKSLRTFLKPLIPYWDDYEVSAIFINGPQDIWVEKRGYSYQVEESFSAEHLHQAIRHIAQLAGILINEDNPQFFTVLPDGSDISVILPPLSKQGPIVSLRKSNVQNASLDDLVADEFLSPVCAEFLEAALQARQSILFVGDRECGTQILIQALINTLPESERLISLERKNEYVFEHKHLLRFALPAQEGFRSGSEFVTNFFSQLPFLRPSRLLISSLAGRYALELIQVTQRGYPGSLASIHGCQPLHATRLLESECLAFDESLSIKGLRVQIAGAFNLYVVCQRDANGHRGVTEVTESRGIDDFGAYRFHPIFTRNSYTIESDGTPFSSPILPTTSVPSFLPQLELFGFGQINQEFFDPSNYDKKGFLKPTNKPIEESIATSDNSLTVENKSNLLLNSVALEKNEHVQENLEDTFVPPLSKEKESSWHVEQKKLGKTTINSISSTITGNSVPVISSIEEEHETPPSVQGGAYSQSIELPQDSLLETSEEYTNPVGQQWEEKTALPIPLSSEHQKIPNDPSQILDISDMIVDESRNASIANEKIYTQEKQRENYSLNNVKTSGVENSPSHAGTIPQSTAGHDDKESLTKSQKPFPSSSIPKPSTPPPIFDDKEHSPQGKRSVVVRRGRRNTFEPPIHFGVEDAASTSIRARPPSLPPRPHHPVERVPKITKPSSISPQNMKELGLDPATLSTEATVIRGRPPKKGK